MNLSNAAKELPLKLSPFSISNLLEFQSEI